VKLALFTAPYHKGFTMQGNGALCHSKMYAMLAGRVCRDLVRDDMPSAQNRSSG
jgi:hypothetical protein